MWPFKSKPSNIPRKLAPTPEMVAEAKRNPNGWVYQIDGDFQPHDRVPPEAIVGAYKVDGQGQLTGEFKANPNYRQRSEGDI